MKLIDALGLAIGLTVIIACGPARPQAVETHLVRTTESDSLTEMENAPQNLSPEVPVDYLLGRFEPGEDSQFAMIADAHSAGSGRGAYLHGEAYAAFVEMYQAAKAEGITLTILSATRNFARQKQIWEAKWNGQRKVSGKNLATAVPDPQERALLILRYSSMPGTSRHHWGTDMDLNAFENDYFETGQGKKEYDWLVAHAADFGFCQPYTEKGNARPHGYEEERWHWSYMPLAKPYLAAYQQQISPEMITGFAGAEVAAPLSVIERYVAGVSEACK